MRNDLGKDSRGSAQAGLTVNGQTHRLRKSRAFRFDGTERRIGVTVFLAGNLHAMVLAISPAANR